MKKSSLVFLTLFAVSLTACGNSGLKHEHSTSTPVEENRIEPTCTAPGSYDLVTYCVDDHEEMSREHKVLGALGHDLIHHNGKAATCTENGYAAYDTCSRCDYTTYQVISAKGHTSGIPVEENRVEPDCTREGSYDLVTYCVDDHVELFREHKTIPALGHNYIKTETHATYDADGYYTYTCSRCNDIYNESNGENRLTYTITWKNYDGTILSVEQYHKGETPFYGGETPTKVEEEHIYVFVGWDKEISEVNDNVTYTASFVEVTLKSDDIHHWYEDEEGNKYQVEEHNCVHETVIKSSTCQTKGSAQYSCDCGYFEVRELDLIPHEFGAFVSNNDATCVEDGTKYHICKMCLYKETVTDEGSATGHKWTLDTENSTAATCLEDGHYHYICDDCDEAKDEIIPNFGGHSFNNYGSCTKCGEFKYSNCVSLNVELPHEFTYWTSGSGSNIYNKSIVETAYIQCYRTNVDNPGLQFSFKVKTSYRNSYYNDSLTKDVHIKYAVINDTDNESLKSGELIIYQNVEEVGMSVKSIEYFINDGIVLDGSKHYTIRLSDSSRF